MALQDIVVGLDGSTGSSDALRWASGLADDVSASLRAISTWQLPLEASMAPLIGSLPSQAFIANHCAELLDKALSESGLTDVEYEIREGDAGPVLARESGIADLVVVGRTGNGHRSAVTRLTEMVLGSVARYCIHHAEGAVAAVPADQTWTRNPTVVVGVDGSDASMAALKWAVNHLPTAKIHAVRAVAPYLEGLLPFDHGILDRILDATDAELDAAISEALAPLGDNAIRSVEPVVVVEHPRYALMSPGFDVDLIVVGERGHGPVAARMLGSISDHVIRHAPCPVIVIPTERKTES